VPHPDAGSQQGHESKANGRTVDELQPDKPDDVCVEVFSDHLSDPCGVWYRFFIRD